MDYIRIVFVFVVIVYGSLLEHFKNSLEEEGCIVWLVGEITKFILGVGYP